MRMTASSRGVWALRSRMMAPRRSPFSRIRCRSIRPSETSAVSEPAKNAETTSDRRRRARRGRSVDPCRVLSRAESTGAREHALEGPAGGVGEPGSAGGRRARAPGGRRDRRTRRRRWRRCAGGRGAAARLTAVAPKRRRHAPRPIPSTRRARAAASPRGPAAAAAAFQGQTSWQTSQPKTWSPSAAFDVLGHRPAVLDRPVREAARRVEDAGRDEAPPSGRRRGIARRSRTARRRGRPAAGRGRSRSRRAAGRSPASASMRQPFLPIQPRPAAAAKERSAIGVESTQTRLGPVAGQAPPSRPRRRGTARPRREP